MQLFTGRTGCTVCHAGAEFSLATHSGVNGNDPLKKGRDTGYFYIGVRPIAEDVGLGGLDGFGKPLATSLPTDDSPASARGRFKTPGLRNVEFTGPYFHNGGLATLGQVMEFYNRGGDFPVNPSNGPDIRLRSTSAPGSGGLVNFMKALTDDRVRLRARSFRSSRVVRSRRSPPGGRGFGLATERQSGVQHECGRPLGRDSGCWPQRKHARLCKPSRNCLPASEPMEAAPIICPTHARSKR